MADTMRTRMIPSMTNLEVERYLDRADIVIVPVGVNELHGCMPLDTEYVMAEAWARMIAEQVDGLVLPNLVYFHPGATQRGRGTVHMSMTDGYRYIKAIMESLLQQGFRRQIYIPAHGPTKGFLFSAVTEFFDENKVPIMMLEPRTYLSTRGLIPDMSKSMATMGRNLSPITKGDVLGANTEKLGCYKICNRLADIPTGVEANIEEVLWDEKWTGNSFYENYSVFSGSSTVHISPAFYYEELKNHGCAPLPETREEIESEAIIGEKSMRDKAALVNWKAITDEMQKFDKFQKGVIAKYGDRFPRNKWSPNV